MTESWDRQLEVRALAGNQGRLPDCRLRGTARARTIMRAHMEWELVFCANCGKEGGMVTAEWTPHVFYLCDRCAAWGAEQQLGLQQAPDEIVRGYGEGR
jgi:hypothetical protein